jgi:flagellar basal-body rod protein FlgB
MLSKAMFGSSTIPVLEQVVNFAQSRHNVLAGNLANLDTPGYKVRDLSTDKFQARLKEALQARNQQSTYNASTAVSSSELIHQRPSELEEVGKDVAGLLYHDESNVGLEQQIAEINKNQTRHNVALAIMNSQFRLLSAAISERA